MAEQLYILPILLFSVVIHEVSHGWMALRLGDTTARDLGRLTLNPIPHIDPVGSVIVPLLSLASSGQVFIAWAKPVPINPLNFSRVRRDDILVSVVGPLSNVVMAFLCTVCVILLAHITPPAGESSFRPAGVSPGALVDAVRTFMMKMFAGGISLNIVLAVFNLIPLPPLDGSHVLASLLPERLGRSYRRIGFLGIVMIILLMRWAPFAGAFSKVIEVLISPFQSLVSAFV